MKVWKKRKRSGNRCFT